MTERHSDLDVMRHSFAHVLAFAVTRLYPDAKLGIGPVVENGFYHDFLFETPTNQKDLAKIEEEMKKIIDEEVTFQQIFVAKEQAFDILNLQGQVFKTEILSSIPDQEVSFYKTGPEFIDLCRGPHVEHTGQLGEFKLTGISGVYWNNDESRPQMQRITGVAFKNADDLNRYFEVQEEKQEKDHRKIAQQLNLYTYVPENGPGLPIFLPKGTAVLDAMKDIIRKETEKIGTNFVRTPLISKSDIFKSESQTRFGKLNLEEEDYDLKFEPFSHLHQIFNLHIRSYRELPYILSEFTTIFDNIKSGEVSGLSNVRNFTTDTHVAYVNNETASSVLKEIIDLICRVYQYLGLEDYKLELALKSPSGKNYIGDPKIWEKTENFLINSTKSTKAQIVEAPGKARTNGPGINFKFKDVYNRKYNLGFIHFDTTAHTEYNLKYADSGNKPKSPYVIKFSVSGSIERLFGIMIEHLGTNLPIWLTPIQVMVIPISEKYNEYAHKVAAELIEEKVRTKVNIAADTMQNKIRDAQQDLIPYMLVVGEKEKTNETISVRPRSGQDLGMMRIEEFRDKILKEIENKEDF